MPSKNLRLGLTNKDFVSFFHVMCKDNPPIYVQALVKTIVPALFEREL